MYSHYFSRAGEMGDWMRYHPKGNEKVLLREAEMCRQCGGTYLSLYPITSCSDHDGLDEA